MNISEIFEGEPRQWGLRGDAYLWEELKERFKQIEMPKTKSRLLELIQNEYLTVTEKSITQLEPFWIERFSHGGISSGGICPEFWNDKAIPLLLARHKK